MSSAQKYLTDHKRPAHLPITTIREGSENPAFLQELTTKGRRKFKRSTGGPTVEQKGDMGCYLTLSDASNGSMFLHWSTDAVYGHVGYFKPTKKVPAFKFKTNGGKSELTRGTNNTKS